MLLLQRESLTFKTFQKLITLGEVNFCELKWEKIENSNSLFFYFKKNHLRAIVLVFQGNTCMQCRIIELFVNNFRNNNLYKYKHMWDTEVHGIILQGLNNCFTTDRNIQNYSNSLKGFIFHCNLTLLKNSAPPLMWLPWGNGKSGRRREVTDGEG